MAHEFRQRDQHGVGDLRNPGLLLHKGETFVQQETSRRIGHARDRERSSGVVNTINGKGDP